MRQTKTQISRNATIEESDLNLRWAHMSEGTFSDPATHTNTNIMKHELCITLTYVIVYRHQIIAFLK